jgi:hypothetical protein
MFVSVLALTMMTPAVQAAIPTEQARPAEKRVCKSVVATGSRLSRQRICLTEREREEESEITRKELDDQRVQVGQPGAGPR